MADYKKKLRILKRKLQTDKQKTYNTRLRVKEQKKEKRLLERKRYKKKDDMLNKSEIVKFSSDVPFQHDSQSGAKNIKKDKKAYERQKKKQQRAKIRADPHQYEKYLQKRRNNYQNKKKEGLIKTISDMNKNEKKNQRQKWREQQRNHRKKKVDQSRNSLLNQTNQNVSEQQESRKKISQKIVGFKVARKNRNLLKKKIQ